jgi:L-lactate dehydrogenase complex protein LldG
VVLLASPDKPRRASLLPPRCVFILDRKNLVDDLEGLADRLEGLRVSGALPSAVNIVTGPSRTADIEKVLTIGVHGPGEVVTILFG